MNAREQGFLLLTSSFGDPERKPLTIPQLRTLAKRIRTMLPPSENRELMQTDLLDIGYSAGEAQRILHLLSQQNTLNDYLQQGARNGCYPITRVSPHYPALLRQRLGLDTPGCLWAKGDLSILSGPAIALVGSRELNKNNRRFAEEAGRQAALQGITLISGNARGADRAAQESCLAHGGTVISVVADALAKCPPQDHILYLSEDSFDLPFSTQRALSRNRVIHCLGQKTLIAQCSLFQGGTWDGTAKNLTQQWSPVFCYDDHSEAANELARMGAVLIQENHLSNLSLLQENAPNFLNYTP